ncbi:MAG TPA: hypothetical protein VFG68_19720 [Fimbriiglobus sp.]|nr:hypothetical protein [Fimbriiglobus sp.]
MTRLYSLLSQASGSLAVALLAVALVATTNRIAFADSVTCPCDPNDPNYQQCQEQCIGFCNSLCAIACGPWGGGPGTGTPCTGSCTGTGCHFGCGCTQVTNCNECG